MSSYYYLDIELVFENGQNPEIPPAYFKFTIIKAVRQLFGETASSAPIDVLKYDEISKRAIIRIPSNLYVKIRSSLTLFSAYSERERCSFIIRKATPLLLALQGDSRDFEH